VRERDYEEGSHLGYDNTDLGRFKGEWAAIVKELKREVEVGNCVR